MAPAGRLKAGTQKIEKDFRLEEVVEREEVEEKPKIYLKDEEELVGKSIKSLLQEDISSKREEPDEMPGLSGNISVTDGSRTEDLKTTVTPKAKEKVIKTRDEAKRKKSVVVEGEPTKQKPQEKECSVQKSDFSVSNRDIKDTKKDTKEHQEAYHSIERKAEKPDLSVKTVSDQVEPKLSVRKLELSSVTDSESSEKASLQKKLRQTDQEDEILKTKNIETTSKTKETEDILKKGNKGKLSKATSKLLPESILSEVVTLKDKLVKVSPMEGTTEVKPTRKTSVSPVVEIKHPESLSDMENLTDKNLQKPENLSKSRTLKDVVQKVSKQTVVEVEEDVKAAVYKDEQVLPKEKAKPRQEQKQAELEPHSPEEFTTKAEDTGSKVKVVQVEGICLKEKEQRLKETKVQPEMVTNEDKQHKTKQEQTERKAPPDAEKTYVKSLTEQEKEEKDKERRQISSKSDKVEDKTVTDKQKKPARKEQLGRKGSDMPEMHKATEISTTESESVSPQEPQQKLTKPQDFIVEQDQLRVSTVKDKTFKVTPLKETKTTQGQTERKVSVTPLISDTSEGLKVAPAKQAEIKEIEFSSADEVIHVSEDQKESISMQEKRQKLAKSKEAADKEMTQKIVTAPEKTKKVTQIKVGTPEKQAKAKEVVTEFATFDEEVDMTESEFVSSQEPERKLHKNVVDQDQLKVSTVKDTTFKVTPLKDKKLKQEQIERKVSVAPMMEVTSEELTVTKEKLEFAVEEKGGHGSDGIPPKDSISLKETRQNFDQTKEAADEQIPSQFIIVEDNFVQVTHTEDGIPKTPEKQIKRKDLDAPEVKPYKETFMGQDTQQKFAQTQKTEKKGIPKSEPSSLQDETPKIKRLLKLPKTGDEIAEVEIVSSVVPLVEEPAEKYITVKDKDVKIGIPQQREITGEEIWANLVPDVHKTDKVASIEMITHKRQEQPSEVEPEETYAKSLVEDDASEKYAVTEIILKDRENEKEDIHKFQTIPLEKEELIPDREKKSVKIKGDTKKDKTAEYAPLKEEKTKQEDTETKPEVIFKMEGKENKPDDISQEKDKSQKLIKTLKTAVEPIKVETGKVPPTVKTKPVRQEQTERKDSVTALRDKPSKKWTPEEIQSKTVLVKDEYGSVAPVEVTKQSEMKLSVAPVMEVASERYLIVKEGEVKSESLQRYVTPDELVKDIASRKETVCKSDGISPKSVESLKDMKDVKIEQTIAKVDRVQDKTEKVTLISETLPKRQEKNEGKASVTSKTEVTDQHSLAEAPEKLTVMDKTTTVILAEEIKPRQKQTEMKPVVPPLIDAQDIQSKKSKSLTEKGQKLDKGGRTSLQEVQSKSVLIKDEFGVVTPFDNTETKQEQVERTFSFAPVMEVASEKHLMVKEGDVKSDTIQRFITPDKLVKEITSSREDIYEGGEVSLISQSQSPESAKGSVENQETTPVKEATSQFITDKIASVKQQTQQKAERTGVSQQKTQKTLVREDAKTEVAISPKKPHRQKTDEGIQPKTDTVKDVFVSVTPIVETKEEEIQRKASRALVMDVAYESSLIAKEKDAVLDTPQQYISPNDLVKDIQSRKKGTYKSEDITLKIDESTIDNRQRLDQTDKSHVQQSKSKVEIHGDRTTKVTPVEHTRGESNAKELTRQDTPEKYTRVEEVVRDTEKQFPKQTVRESHIDWHEPAAEEPSVTDKTKLKMIKKKATATDYRMDTTEHGEIAARKSKSEVGQSFLKADLQYVPCQEVETISRKEGEARGLQSVVETRVLSCEPERKELVSPPESSRGIEGKVLYVTEHVFLIRAPNIVVHLLVITLFRINEIHSLSSFQEDIHFTSLILFGRKLSYEEPSCCRLRQSLMVSYHLMSKPPWCHVVCWISLILFLTLCLFVCYVH